MARSYYFTVFMENTSTHNGRDHTVEYSNEEINRMMYPMMQLVVEIQLEQIKPLQNELYIILYIISRTCILPKFVERF